MATNVIPFPLQRAKFVGEIAPEDPIGEARFRIAKLRYERDREEQGSVLREVAPIKLAWWEEYLATLLPPCSIREFRRA